MLILSLDTTTRAGSCALWRDGMLVEERVGDAARTHAERLPADLADLLAAHGLAVRDVDLYAVASGPGSFTGLRVGIATVQGLALVHDRRVVPVSALEALAQCGAGARPTSVVGAWMEAYRGEVFGALYRVAVGTAGQSLATLEEIAAPAVGLPEQIAAAWRGALGVVSDTVGAQTSAAGTILSDSIAPDSIAPDSTVIGAVTVIGDAVPTTRAILAAHFPEALLLDPVPLAGMIARLAHAHPERAVRPHAIVPLYVRRPDAELARERARPKDDATRSSSPTPTGARRA